MFPVTASVLASLIALHLVNNNSPPLVAATKAIDVSDPYTAQRMQCIVDKEGFSNFLGVRVSHFGAHCGADTHAALTIPAAVAAGVAKIDGYIFYCPRKCNGVEHVTNTINELKAQNNLAPLNRIWVDVEKQPSCWYDDKAQNTAAIQAAVDALLKVGIPAGIYTAKYPWEEVTSNSVAFAALPLWYAHYDNVLSFDDFNKAPFGGWTQPVLKQYADTAVSTNCPGAKYDMNYGEGYVCSKLGQKCGPASKLANATCCGQLSACNVACKEGVCAQASLNVNGHAAEKFPTPPVGLLVRHSSVGKDKSGSNGCSSSNDTCCEPQICKDGSCCSLDGQSCDTSSTCCSGGCGPNDRPSPEHGTCCAPTQCQDSANQATYISCSKVCKALMPDCSSTPQCSFDGVTCECMFGCSTCDGDAAARLLRCHKCKCGFLEIDCTGCCSAYGTAMVVKSFPRF